MSVRVFRYIPQLDAFVVTDEYRRLGELLGLSEWNPVVWVGRLFTGDNDFGEHWFDNWDEREALKQRAAEMGLDADEVLIIVPDRFQDGRDGPCHPPEIRKRFWTDVLCSLELSHDLLFEEARRTNESMRQILPEEYIADLEARIARVKSGSVPPVAQ